MENWHVFYLPGNNIERKETSCEFERNISIMFCDDSRLLLVLTSFKIIPFLKVCLMTKKLMMLIEIETLCVHPERIKLKN